MKNVTTLSTVILALLCSVAHAQRGWPRGPYSSAHRIQGSPILYDLDADGRLEVITVGLDDYLRVYNHDGTPFENLQARVLGFGDGTSATPAIGDIDGDGDPEIIVAGDDQNDRNAAIKVFAKTGELLQSYPLSGGALASAKATPFIFDVIKYLDGVQHPGKEILYRDGDGQVHVLMWIGNGLTDVYSTQITELQTAINTQNKDRYGAYLATPSIAVRALNNEETLVVSSSTDGRVYRWTITSSPSAPENMITHTPLPSNNPGEEEFYSTARVDDVDGDGILEVVAASNMGYVYLWSLENNGALRTGWPQVMSQSSSSTPVTADLNGDGLKEIVAGCDSGEVFAWDLSGNLITGWPVQTDGDIFATPVIADLTADGFPDILTASVDGKLHLWNNQGFPVFGWPKTLSSTIYATPAIADVHGFGNWSIVAASFDGKLYCFDLASSTAQD